MKKTTAKYEYVLFDLDGTLTDPALGITNSVMYALKKFGISVSDRSELPLYRAAAYVFVQNILRL